MSRLLQFQGTSNIFIGQLPPVINSENKVHAMLVSKLKKNLPFSFKSLVNEKAQFKVALKRY
jgi:hypothetical protein